MGACNDGSQKGRAAEETPGAGWLAIKPVSGWYPQAGVGGGGGGGGGGGEREGEGDDPRSSFLAYTAALRTTMALGGTTTTTTASATPPTAAAASTTTPATAPPPGLTAAHILLLRLHNNDNSHATAAQTATTTTTTFGILIAHSPPDAVLPAPDHSHTATINTRRRKAVTTATTTTTNSTARTRCTLILPRSDTHLHDQLLPTHTLPPIPPPPPHATTHISIHTTATYPSASNTTTTTVLFSAPLRPNTPTRRLIALAAAAASTTQTPREFMARVANSLHGAANLFPHATTHTTQLSHIADSLTSGGGGGGVDGIAYAVTGRGIFAHASLRVAVGGGVTMHHELRPAGSGRPPMRIAMAGLASSTPAPAAHESHVLYAGAMGVSVREIEEIARGGIGCGVASSRAYVWALVDSVMERLAGGDHGACVKVVEENVDRVRGLIVRDATGAAHVAPKISLLKTAPGGGGTTGGGGGATAGGGGMQWRTLYVPWQEIKT